MKRDNEKTLRAGVHDLALASAVSSLSESVVAIGKELAIMRDEELWKYIRKPDLEGVFSSWRDYVKFRLGSMSSSKMYEYLSAASLIHGEKPMPAAEVEELGVKKAAQLARLPEKRRTKKLIKQAKESSVQDVKCMVEGLLDKDAPPDERKVPLVPLTVGLPQEVVDLINEVEKGGQFLESVRDNDRSWTLRAKLWHQVWWDFLDSHREELKAGERYREAHLSGKRTDQTSQVVQ